MNKESDAYTRLQEENSALRLEVRQLKRKLFDAAPSTAALSGKVEQPNDRRSAHMSGTVCDACEKLPPGTFTSGYGLNKDQIERYSRHLLLGSFGPARQASLCNSSVLIVGCGGLGSSAALYLTAAGVGHIGLVDHDIVEASNLHRQIIHTQARVGVHKALSAQEACSKLNPSIKISTHTDGLHARNALKLIGAYDLVLDASDNAATRYLISDACVMSHRPLVSAAAVGTDGQLTVYCHGDQGPCYRCLFPVSPAPENCSRCSDAGVLGVVPGIMGCLQALEAIKVLTMLGEVLSQRLMIFDALAGRFSTVKLRGKREGCAACGSSPTITKESLAEFSYEAFTGSAANDGPDTLDIIPMDERFPATEVDRIIHCARRGGHSIVLLDVRPAAQFDLMRLNGSTNLPMDLFERLGDVELCLALAAGSFIPPCRPTIHTEHAQQDLEVHPAEQQEASSGGDVDMDASSSGGHSKVAVAVEQAPSSTDATIECGSPGGSGGAAAAAAAAPATAAGGGATAAAGYASVAKLAVAPAAAAETGAVANDHGGSEQQGRDDIGCKGHEEEREREQDPAVRVFVDAASAAADAVAAAAAVTAAAAAAGVAAILAESRAGGAMSVAALVAALRPVPVFVICRRGNNSQKAIARLRGLGFDTAMDIIGGYTAWAQEVDGDMPVL